MLGKLSSAMPSITIPSEYGWVLGVAAGSVLVINGWMTVKIGQARKKYGVKYPNMYADKSTNKDADAFNCVQRGHQNSLENYPAFLALLLTTGVRFPISASAAALVWLVGRIVYMQGYSSGDPKARMRGGFNHLGMLGLLGLAIRWAVELLRSK